MGAIIVVDEWGTTRRLTDAGDGTYEGVITVAGEAMAYWLPAAVVDEWRSSFNIERDCDDDFGDGLAGFDLEECEAP